MPRNRMSMPAAVNWRRENDRYSETISGKIDSASTTSRAGQRKTFFGASSLRGPLRPASRGRVAASRPDPSTGVGPRDSSASGLSLDAKTRLVGRELGVATLVVGDLLPAIEDLLHRRVPIDLPGQE